LRLAPGPATIIDEAPAGRLYVDGAKLSTFEESAVKARKALSFAGICVVTVIMDAKGRMLTDPVVVCDGLPEHAAQAAGEAAAEAVEQMSGGKRRNDDDAYISESVKKSVRRAIQTEWGKRPVTRVEVVRVG
ncbi:MAG TPA: MBL fold metallo-hydrolase, partial [Alphaproteobacteria bacterium]|nr:MBL fold metallo-hydrolase [Alphaproteobacteria bacterium]